MNEAKKLREHADAAVRMAESTKSEEGRASLLSIAKTWFRLADQKDRNTWSQPRQDRQTACKDSHSAGGAPPRGSVR